MASNGSKTSSFDAWSKSTTFIFRAAGVLIDTVNAKYLRGDLELVNSTDSIKGKVGYRMTNDGVSFDNPQVLYTSPEKIQTGDGKTYGESFVDVSGSQKRYVQPGVWVANTAGTATEITHVNLTVDFRGA